MRAFLSLLSRFRRDRSGNIAVIFSIAVLPVLYSVGCAVDYSRATQFRSKLQAASDAATVGSVAKAAPGFIAAGSMTSDGPIAAGVTDATNIFNANMNGVTGYTLGAMTATMTKASNAHHLERSVHGYRADDVSRPDGPEFDHRDRHVDFENRYAALYRFLSHAR